MTDRLPSPRFVLRLGRVVRGDHGLLHALEQTVERILRHAELLEDGTEVHPECLRLGERTEDDLGRRHGEARDRRGAVAVTSPVAEVDDADIVDTGETRTNLFERSTDDLLSGVTELGDDGGEHLERDDEPRPVTHRGEGEVLLLETDGFGDELGLNGRTLRLTTLGNTLGFRQEIRLATFGVGEEPGLVAFGVGEEPSLRHFGVGQTHLTTLRSLRRGLTFAFQRQLGLGGFRFGLGGFRLLDRGVGIAFGGDGGSLAGTLRPDGRRLGFGFGRANLGVDQLLLDTTSFLFGESDLRLRLGLQGRDLALAEVLVDLRLLQLLGHVGFGLRRRRLLHERRLLQIEVTVRLGDAFVGGETRGLADLARFRGLDHGLTVRFGLGDGRVALDFRRTLRTHRVDVSFVVPELVDDEVVKLETELVHLHHRVLENALVQLLAIGDHLFDGQGADDLPKQTVERVLEHLLDLIDRLAEHALDRRRELRGIAADLDVGDCLNVDGHAVDVRGLRHLGGNREGFQVEVLELLEERKDEGRAADDESVALAVLLLAAVDDQHLVGRALPVVPSEHQKGREAGDGESDQNDRESEIRENLVHYCLRFDCVFWFVWL